jgi:3-oxoacyl-[acyl-carrier protein] reductase
MNLHLYNQAFIVCGAGSGLGRGVAENLLAEGAVVYAISKTPDKLGSLQKTFPEQLKIFGFDLTDIKSLAIFFQETESVVFSGALLNAGGPPAIASMETRLEDWDAAYSNLVRWKIYFTQQLIPQFKKQNYGRLLYIESAAIKQPIENLILSTSMRLSVTGFVKTLSQELAKDNITMNILAPGFHSTPAVNRVFETKAKNQHISIEDAKKAFLQNIPSRHLGNAENFGKLASFLLSPSASYITGQTISVDGGLTKYIFG